MLESITTFVPGMLFAFLRAVHSSILLLLLSVPVIAHAQESPSRFFEAFKGEARQGPDTPITGAQAPGAITVRADPKVEKLMERYAAIKHAQPGFRVQIYLGSDRKAAEDIKRAFLQKNPDSPAYLSWLAPNYRLRVGDLRTRMEAERMLSDLKPSYPGSYIVPDDIEMPR